MTITVGTMGRKLSMALAIALIVIGSFLMFGGQVFANGGDPNEGAPPGAALVEGAPEALPGTVVATFPGPLDSFSINLDIVNNTRAKLPVFFITGKTVTPDPIIWDAWGTFSSVVGDVTLVGCFGENGFGILCIFSGFDPGEAVRFSGIDPDFEGAPSSGVHIGDIAGAWSAVLAGGLGLAPYQVVGNDVVSTMN